MSSTDNIDVSIPSALGEYVSTRVAAGGFADASQYVAALIDADRISQARVELREFLLAGIQSGPGIPADEAFWEEYRNRAIESARKAQTA